MRVTIKGIEDFSNNNKKILEDEVEGDVTII